jgi:magnesium transporter
MRVIHAMATKYQLHPLAIEDVLHLTQRPKVEPYSGDDNGAHARLFIIARMLQLRQGRLHSEQISLFLGHNTVLTFQERRGDVWECVRQRVNAKGSRLRNNDASFLEYSRVDTIVEHCFPILEGCGEHMEELEDFVLDRPQRNTIVEIHQVIRDLLLLRRAVWPMREVVSTLQREPHECMSEVTRVYHWDLYDHVVQIIDILETYREMATGLTETYMSSTSNRTNEIVKVLMDGCDLSCKGSRQLYPPAGITRNV